MVKPRRHKLAIAVPSRELRRQQFVRVSRQTLEARQTRPPVALRNLEQTPLLKVLFDRPYPRPPIEFARGKDPRGQLVVRAWIHALGFRLGPIVPRNAAANKLTRPYQPSLRIALHGADKVNGIAIDTAPEAHHFEAVAIVSQSKRGTLAAVHRATHTHLVSPSRFNAQSEEPCHFARVG
jgi:hypothetical protein